MLLKSLTLSNYLCFGENTQIDFPKDGNFLIIGDNADTDGMNSNESGKTSFASAPLWALFGMHFSEDAAADDVIRSGTKQCEVSLELIDNKDIIKIIRKRGIQNSLEFYINDNLINKNTTVPTKVQEDINRYFGISGTPKQIIDDFMSTNLLSYNSVDLFVSKRYKAEDRFAFLSRIFNLEKWIECKKYAKEKRDEILPEIEYLSGQLQVYQNTINSISFEEMQQKKEQNIEQIKELKIKIADLKTKINESREYIQIKKELEQKETFLQYLTEKHQKEVKELKQEIKETEFKINSHKDFIASYKEIIENSEIAEYSEKKLLGLKQKKTDAEGNLRLYLYEINQLENEKKEKEILKRNRLKCSECGADQILENGKLVPFNEAIIERQISEIDNKINQVQIKINQTKELIIENNFDIVREEEKIKECEKYRETLNKIKYNKEMLVDYEKSLIRYQENLNTKVNEYENESGDISIYIDDLKIKLQQNQIESNIENLEKDLENFEDSLLEKNNQIAVFETDMLRYKEAETKQRELSDELKKLQEKRDIYKYWEKAFPEIRRMIIQSVLPQIQTISNEYLDKILAPFRIELDTLKEAKTSGNLREAFNINVYDRITDTIMPIHMRSTGGRKRIGMAVCFALLDIKSSYQNKTFNFRFFDEFLDNIDETGMDLFLNLLNNVDGQKFVISHNSKLMERFDKVIKIVKRNGVSLIQKN